MSTAKSKTSKIILTIVIMLIGLACIYPFLFMISSAFKPSGEVLQTPFQLVTENFTFMNFQKIFTHKHYNMAQWYLNTTVMTLITIVIKIFLITITAYAFAKIKFPGRSFIFMFLLASMMIPADIMIMPRYILYSRIGIIDSMWAVILPAAVDAYFVFLLRQSFLGISDSISEAAKIDGCGHLRIYWKIVTPLAKPAITTMVLFSFVWIWNDYMSPYLYITDIKKQMLSVGIKLLAAGQVQDYGAQMAGATVVLIPILVIFVFSQRYFVEGVSAGAVKG